jgi:hypothetical protein
MSQALVRPFQERLHRDTTVDYLQVPPLRPRPRATPEA